METAWLRRRPSRFTGDKFVCVSWAATLGSRTLTRSCQREGKSRPSTSSALPPPPLLLSACMAPSNKPSRARRRRQTPPGAEAFLWDLGLHPRSPPTPPVCTVEVPKTHWHTQSKLPQAHNGSPRRLPLSHGKIMDGGVWQRRRTTYENTILSAASALFWVSFVCGTVSEETPRLENWWFVMWKRSCRHKASDCRGTRRSWTEPRTEAFVSTDAV